MYVCMHVLQVIKKRLPEQSLQISDPYLRSQ